MSYKFFTHPISDPTMPFFFFVSCYWRLAASKTQYEIQARRNSWDENIDDQEESDNDDDDVPQLNPIANGSTSTVTKIISNRGFDTASTGNLSEKGVNIYDASCIRATSSALGCFTVWWRYASGWQPKEYV